MVFIIQGSACFVGLPVMFQLQDYPRPSSNYVGSYTTWSSFVDVSRVISTIQFDDSSVTPKPSTLNPKLDPEP